MSGAGNLESSTPRGQRTRAERARVPLRQEVERRAEELVRLALAEVDKLPPLSAEDTRALRVLWRAYQLAHQLPMVPGETLIEVYTLDRLRTAVSRTVGLGARPAPVPSPSPHAPGSDASACLPPAPLTD